jgi:leucyl/phenylalanyl-tRNA--protein transferase
MRATWRVVSIEPKPTIWELPDPERAPSGEELIGVGADLEPGTLLAAYRRGLFPMRVGPLGQIGWWSPDPRGVMPLDGFVVHRSLAKARRRFEIRFDTAFTAVMRACADPARPQGWIDESFIAAYTRLFELGWAHSIEVWSEGETLVGGLYGIGIGGFFAGESMFHRARDASKVAVWACTERLAAIGVALFDVQWETPHLASLGVVEVSRPDYLGQLRAAHAAPADWDAFAPHRAAEGRGGVNS